MRKEPADVRLYRRVVAGPGGCHVWTGSTNGRGYGYLKVGSRLERAHRFAYELHRGPIPPGRQIDHLCRNRRCVNPHHLEAVTPAVNTERGYVARNGEGLCKRGHPRDPVNLYMRDGAKRCRECDRVVRLARTARKRGDHA